METKDFDHLKKPQKKSVDGPWEIANEPAKVRPELLSEEEKMPQADPFQDKEPRYYSPIQRNSIFNRTVRLRSKGKARDTPEPNAGHLAGQYQGQLSQLFLGIHLESSGLKGPE